MRLEEELETVGLKKVRKGLPQHPTENDVREDYLNAFTTDGRLIDTSSVRPPHRPGPPLSSSSLVRRNYFASVSDRADYDGKAKADWNGRLRKKGLPRTDR